MFQSLSTEQQLLEIRERHRQLRRQAELARLNRKTKHLHRFRSRQRRT